MASTGGAFESSGKSRSGSTATPRPARVLDSVGLGCHLDDREDNAPAGGVVDEQISDADAWPPWEAGRVCALEASVCAEPVIGHDPPCVPDRLEPVLQGGDAAYLPRSPIACQARRARFAAPVVGY
jgi:hypothetical protein